MIRNIRQDIQNQVDDWQAMGQPALMQRFILEKGRAWIPQALPKPFERLTPKNCFQNSYVLAELDHHYKFVEGLALNQNVDMLVHHAWCVDADNRVVDLTWEKPAECLYFGIRFNHFRVVKHQTDITGCYSILDSDSGLNTKFMFEESPKLKRLAEGWHKIAKESRQVREELLAQFKRG